MDSFVSIGEAAQALRVSIIPLRCWEHEGKRVPAYPSGGHRRDDLAKWCPERFPAAADVTRKTVVDARGLSHDQTDDREHQKQGLELYGARRGWIFEVVADLGSGVNDHKNGLKRLLNAILTDQTGRQVMTHKDRPIMTATSRRRSLCEKWPKRALRRVLGSRGAMNQEGGARNGQGHQNGKISLNPAPMPFDYGSVTIRAKVRYSRF